MTASGLTDVFQKLLTKNVSTKGNKSIVLRNEKIDAPKRKGNLISTDSDKDSAEDSDGQPPLKLAKKMDKQSLNKAIKQEARARWIRQCFKGDNDSMRQSAIREKHLRRQATRATVQLFNAVREHQSKVRASLAADGTTEAKREKVEKSHASSIEFLKRLEKRTEQEQSGDKWKQYLKKDFAMGSKMKAWDLEPDSSDEEIDE